MADAATCIAVLSRSDDEFLIRYKPYRNTASRWRDGSILLLMGGLLAGAALVMLSTPLEDLAQAVSGHLPDRSAEDLTPYLMQIIFGVLIGVFAVASFYQALSPRSFLIRHRADMLTIEPPLSFRQLIDASARKHRTKKFPTADISAFFATDQFMGASPTYMRAVAAQNRDGTETPVFVYLTNKEHAEALAGFFNEQIIGEEGRANAGRL